MPRYFFNVIHGDEHFRDEIGEDLADNVSAWHEATASAGQSIRDLDGKLKPRTTWRMEVLNEAGQTIYTIEVTARASRIRSSPA